jgi:hypothetical protein
MRGRYLFHAGRKDHWFEVLEIGPEGLRLLVPRQMLLIAFGLALAIGYFLGSQLLLSAILAARPTDLSVITLIALLIPVWLIGAPVLVGLFAIKILPWAAAQWPRSVIRLQFRTIEPRGMTHWIRVSAEGVDTWIQVAGRRGRVTSALLRTGRSVAVDTAT